LNKENLDGDSLIIYPLIDEAQINFVNWFQIFLFIVYFNNF
jgi:hypothetical protein